jgi:hypothetical protein
VLLFSLWSKEFALQEDSMVAGQTSFRSLKSISGACAFVLGFFLLFVNLDGFAPLLNHAAGAPAETVGILPAVGLAVLHAVHAYTFDESGFLSSLLRILVSFWPLLLIVVGATMLLHTFKGSSATPVGAQAAGERP